MIVRSEVSLYRRRLFTPLSSASYAHFAIGGKTTAVGMINHGDGSEKRCPSLYETTGNEIYRHGQRKLPARALIFKATGGDEIYTNPFIYRRWAGISALLFIYAYLYIRI